MLIVERVYTRDFLQWTRQCAQLCNQQQRGRHLRVITARQFVNAALTLNHIHARASWSVLLLLTFFL